MHPVWCLSRAVQNQFEDWLFMLLQFCIQQGQECQPGLHHVHVWKGHTRGYKKAMEILDKQVIARIERTQNQHCRKLIFLLLYHTTSLLLHKSFLPSLLSQSEEQVRIQQLKFKYIIGALLICTENCGTDHHLGIVGQTDIVTASVFIGLPLYLGLMGPDCRTIRQ